MAGPRNRRGHAVRREPGEALDIVVVQRGTPAATDEQDGKLQSADDAAKLRSASEDVVDDRPVGQHPRVARQPHTRPGERGIGHDVDEHQARGATF